MVSGVYRLEKIRSFADDSYESRAVGVRIESVSMFQDNHYVLTSLNKAQTGVFTKEFESLLNDVAFNPYLQLEE